MTRRRGATLVVASVLLLTTAGCAPGGSGSDPGNPNQLEAMTSWATDTDRAGLDALEQVFAQQHPGIEFIDASVAGGDGAAVQHALTLRLEADNPPDTFLTSGGAGLAVDTARLRDLGDFLDDEGLRGDAFRAGLLDRIAVGGEIYAIPAAVHRVNVVWLNTALVRAAGFDATRAPSGVDDWLDQLEALRRSGTEFPLAVGGGRAKAVLFESLLLADLGDWRYRELWTSAAGWDTALLDTAIGQFSRLLDYADPSAGDESGQESAQRIIDGTAAYLVSADLAVAAFDDAGLLFGREYSAYPAPGTKGVFDFAASAFAVPADAAHQDAATAWLGTISSKAGQVALALAAGSIPARSDVDPQAFGRYQQTAITSLAKDSIVSSFAYGLAASPDWADQIAEALDRFAVDRKPAALHNRLVTAATDAFAS